MPMASLHVESLFEFHVLIKKIVNRIVFLIYISKNQCE